MLLLQINLKYENISAKDQEAKNNLNVSKMAMILGSNLLISHMQKSCYFHWKFLLILHTTESVMPSNKPCPSKHFKLPLSYSTCDTSSSRKSRNKRRRKVTQRTTVVLLKREVYELRKSRCSKDKKVVTRGASSCQRKPLEAQCQCIQHLVLGVQQIHIKLESKEKSPCRQPE